MGGQELSGIWKGKQNKTKQRDAEAFTLLFLPGRKVQSFLLSTVLLPVSKKDNPGILLPEEVQTHAPGGTDQLESTGKHFLY